jgi:hypothetical protein
MSEQSVMALCAEPNWGESEKSSRLRTQPLSRGSVITLTR